MFNEDWFSKISRLYRADRRSLSTEHLRNLAFLKGNFAILQNLYAKRELPIETDTFEEDEAVGGDETDDERRNERDDENEQRNEVHFDRIYEQQYS